MMVKSKGIIKITVMWMILIISVVMVTDIVGGEGQGKRSSWEWQNPHLAGVDCQWCGYHRNCLW